jgi:anti-sigma factor RsiW
MTCRKSAYLMQLYIDGRLAPARHVHLEQHLSSCAACRRELALLEVVRDAASAGELAPESPDLAPLIMRRVVAFEARRALAADREHAPSGPPLGLPRWAIGWRGAALALLMLLIVALLQPAAFGGIGGALTRDVSGAVQALLGPGPDAISWAVWALGSAVALAIAVWFARADASSGWRRAIAQRLPQLW